MIKTALKHFIYNIAIESFFDKLIENFPPNRYDLEHIYFDDIMIGDTIVSICKQYQDTLYIGVVKSINHSNYSIYYDITYVGDAISMQWKKAEVTPVFSEAYYFFMKRITIK